MSTSETSTLAATVLFVAFASTAPGTDSASMRPVSASTALECDIDEHFRAMLEETLRGVDLDSLTHFTDADEFRRSLGLAD
jgi:hypothetical protein